jgi:hypothetical protein
MKIKQCKTKNEIVQWTEKKIKQIDEKIVNKVKIAQKQRKEIIKKANKQLKKLKGGKERAND